MKKVIYFIMALVIFITNTATAKADEVPTNGGIFQIAKKSEAGLLYIQLVLNNYNDKENKDWEVPRCKGAWDIINETNVRPNDEEAISFKAMLYLYVANACGFEPGSKQYLDVKAWEKKVLPKNKQDNFSLKCEKDSYFLNSIGEHITRHMIISELIINAEKKGVKLSKEDLKIKKTSLEKSMISTLILQEEIEKFLEDNTCRNEAADQTIIKMVDLHRVIRETIGIGN